MKSHIINTTISAYLNEEVTLDELTKVIHIFKAEADIRYEIVKYISAQQDYNYNLIIAAQEKQNKLTEILMQMNKDNQ